jgi:hypothetical protein
MKRVLALVIATLAGLFLAAKGQSEVIGTVVSTDPVGNTIMVRAPDGTQTLYRTLDTTRIEQGGSVVQLRTIQPGTQVQIVAEPAPPTTTTGTVVYPVASGIVVAPTTPPPNAAPPTYSPKASGDSETKIEREVKIKEKHEHEDDSD